ncbi:23S rRNA pseudouridine(2457) synthase [Gammaproteobacteria bacterium]
MIVLFNKPYGVLSQFTGAPGQATLADYLAIPAIRAAGRLDRDSEGLLLLTDDGRLQHRLTNPQTNTWKTYWAEVEGVPTATALARLREGLILNDGPTQTAKARVMATPALWPRDPPVRTRVHIPTTWVEIQLHEGRNRQVRRMTATVGFPTLRLVRVALGEWRLRGLGPGEWRVIGA